MSFRYEHSTDVGGSPIRLSVLTATYNAATTLPALISSLAEQTDSNFEWVVADGGSSDATETIVSDARSRFAGVVFDSASDFGIYDALNRAVRLATGDYYIVVGADDVLHREAISLYRDAIVRTHADIVSADVSMNGQIVRRRRPGWLFLHGAFAFVSGHSVGVAIRRNIHDEYGLYSRRFPIAADQLFLEHAIRGGASVSSARFVAGTYASSSGTSGRDVLGTITESARARIAAGAHPGVQVAVMMFRLCLNWGRIARARS